MDSRTVPTYELHLALQVRMLFDSNKIVVRNPHDSDKTWAKSEIVGNDFI